MQALLAPLKELAEYDEVRKIVRQGKGTVALSGCVDSQKLHMIYGLSDGLKYKVIVTYNDLKAKEIYEEYRFYDRNVMLYPAKDLIFFQADIHGNQLVQERIKTLRRVVEGKPVTIVTTYAALMTPQVLWEEKLSYYDLMVMRVSEGEASFNSEEQNEPINPDDCLFMEEWFDYYNEAEVNFGDPAFDFFGFIDPSLGKTKRSDFSAIVTLAKHRSSGYMYVVDADIERRHPDRIIADVLAKERWLRASFGHGYRKLGAETNQFQWFLKEELAKASAKAGLYLPIEEVQQTSDKVMRIQTLQPDVKNKYIKFNRRHKRLLEQLTQFPMGAHDDGPDALEGARSIAKRVKRFRILDRAEFGI